MRRSNEGKYYGEKVKEEKEEGKRRGAAKEDLVSHSLLTHYIGTALAKVICDLLVVKSNY